MNVIVQIPMLLLLFSISTLDMGDDFENPDIHVPIGDWLAQYQVSDECVECVSPLARQTMILLSPYFDVEYAEGKFYVDAYLAETSGIIRKPVEGASIFVEVYDTGGKHRGTCYTVTDKDGKATFNFGLDESANKYYFCKEEGCLFRFIFCCADLESECMLQSCLSEEFDNYRNIDPCPAISTQQNSALLDDEGNKIILLPSYAEVEYNISRALPLLDMNFELCLPALLIVGLLSAAMFAVGRNPFGMFDFSALRFSKGARRPIRARGYSLNIMGMSQTLFRTAAAGVAGGLAGGKGVGESIKEGFKAAGEGFTKGGILGKEGLLGSVEEGFTAGLKGEKAEGTGIDTAMMKEKGYGVQLVVSQMATGISGAAGALLRGKGGLALDSLLSGLAGGGRAMIGMSSPAKAAQEKADAALHKGQKLKVGFGGVEGYEAGKGPTTAGDAGLALLKALAVSSAFGGAFLYLGSDTFKSKEEKEKEKIEMAIAISRITGGQTAIETFKQVVKDEKGNERTVFVTSERGELKITVTSFDKDGAKKDVFYDSDKGQKIRKISTDKDGKPLKDKNGNEMFTFEVTSKGGKKINSFTFSSEQPGSFSHGVLIEDGGGTIAHFDLTTKEGRGALESYNTTVLNSKIEVMNNLTSPEGKLALAELRNSALRKVDLGTLEGAETIAEANRGIESLKIENIKDMEKAFKKADSPREKNKVILASFIQADRLISQKDYAGAEELTTKALKHISVSEYALPEHTENIGTHIESAASTALFAKHMESLSKSFAPATVQAEGAVLHSPESIRNTITQLKESSKILNAMTLDNAAHINTMYSKGISVDTAGKNYIHPAEISAKTADLLVVAQKAAEVSTNFDLIPEKRKKDFAKADSTARDLVARSMDMAYLHPERTFSKQDKRLDQFLSSGSFSKTKKLSFEVAKLDQMINVYGKNRGKLTNDFNDYGNISQEYNIAKGVHDGYIDKGTYGDAATKKYVKQLESMPEKKLGELVNKLDGQRKHNTSTLLRKSDSVLNESYRSSMAIEHENIRGLFAREDKLPEKAARTSDITKDDYKKTRARFEKKWRTERGRKVTEREMKQRLDMLGAATTGAAARGPTVSEMAGMIGKKPPKKVAKKKRKPKA